jgi:hypothetical protein
LTVCFINVYDNPLDDDDDDDDDGDVNDGYDNNPADN